MTMVLVAGPAEEPITAAEARDFMRFDDTSEDGLIRELITAARIDLETRLRRQIITATYDLVLPCFPRKNGPIQPPKPPLSAVASITYFDAGDVAQTWAAGNYRVDTGRAPGSIESVVGATWPATRKRYDAVTVRLTAGYGAADNVPQNVKLMLKLATAQRFFGREPAAEKAAGTLESMIRREAVFEFK